MKDICNVKQKQIFIMQHKKKTNQYSDYYSNKSYWNKKIKQIYIKSKKRYIENSVTTNQSIALSNQMNGQLFFNHEIKN